MAKQRLNRRLDQLEAEHAPAARYFFWEFEGGIGLQELRQKELERLSPGPQDHHFVTIYGCRPEEVGKKPAKFLGVSEARRPEATNGRGPGR